MHSFKKLALLSSLLSLTILSAPQARADYSIYIPTVGMVSIPDITITKQPVSSLNMEGKSVTLKVTAKLKSKAYGKNELQYQWYKNGVAIPGANKSSYVVTRGTSANDGSYHVVVKNVLKVTYKLLLVEINDTYTTDTKTSSSAHLIFANPAVISNTPKNQVLDEGSTFTFSPTIVGANVTYQWQKNGTNIPGATSATYTLSNITENDAGSYRVVATNRGGTVTGKATQITVKPLLAQSSFMAGTTITLTDSSNQEYGQVYFLENSTSTTGVDAAIRIGQEVTYGTINRLSDVTKKTFRFVFSGTADDYTEETNLVFTLTSNTAGSFSYSRLDNVDGTTLASGTFNVTNQILPTTKSRLSSILLDAIPEGFNLQATTSKVANGVTTNSGLQLRVFGTKLGVVETTSTGTVLSNVYDFQYLRTQNHATLQYGNNTLHLMAESDKTGSLAIYNSETHEFYYGRYTTEKVSTSSYAQTKLSPRRKLSFTIAGTTSPSAIYTVTDVGMNYSSGLNSAVTPVVYIYSKSTKLVSEVSISDHAPESDAVFYYKLLWSSSSKGVFMRLESDGSYTQGTFSYN